jgi:hypothetical protein
MLKERTKVVLKWLYSRSNQHFDRGHCPGEGESTGACFGPTRFIDLIISHSKAPAIVEDIVANREEAEQVLAAIMGLNG